MGPAKVVSKCRRVPARRRAASTGRAITIALALALAIALGVIVYRGIQQPSIIAGAPRVGQQMPAFALPGLRGETVRLADYHGKVVLVNFWATWCPPCKAEMPALQKVYDRHRAKGFEIVGIDQAEGPAVVEPFVKERNFTWTFALDLDGAFSRDLQVLGIPMSFLVDRDGKVLYIWSGALDEASLERKLATLGIAP